MSATAPIGAVFAAGDLIRLLLGGGTIWVLGLTVLACAARHGVRTTLRAFACALIGRRAVRAGDAGDMTELGRVLRLAERTWLAVGLVVLLMPWITNLAQIRSGIEDPGLLREMALPLPVFMPVLLNVVVARLVIGGRARGLEHRAVEAAGAPLDAVGSRGGDWAGDALVLAHLAVPPLWLPLMFFSFPV